MTWVVKYLNILFQTLTHCFFNLNITISSQWTFMNNPVLYSAENLFWIFTYISYDIYWVIIISTLMSVIWALYFKCPLSQRYSFTTNRAFSHTINYLTLSTVVLNHSKYCVCCWLTRGFFSIKNHTWHHSSGQ